VVLREFCSKPNLLLSVEHKYYSYYLVWLHVAAAFDHH